MIFAGMDTAAVAALQEAAVCSHNVRECGGVIYERDGRFFYDVPHPGRQFGVDLPEYDDALPPRVHIVADYHVHVCADRNRDFSPYFSMADSLVNQGFHTVGYMLSLCDDNVRRFDPRQDDMGDEEVDFRPRPDGTRHKPIYLTCGHIVGWVPYELERMRVEWRT